MRSGIVPGVRDRWTAAYLPPKKGRLGFTAFRIVTGRAVSRFGAVVLHVGSTCEANTISGIYQFRMVGGGEGP